jgi:hypothetical protein
MFWLELAIPGLLLATKFFFRLFANHSPNSAEGTMALLALPVDIVFLAASFVAANAIRNTSTPTALHTNVTYLISCMLLAFLIISLWRSTDLWFSKDRWILSTIVFLFNVLVSGVTLVFSVALLTGHIE